MRNERVAYLNGQLVPESQALLSIRDSGFVYGDAVFDTARTFNGKIFRLKEHVDRLYRSLRYVRIDPGLSPEEMLRTTEQVVEENLPLLREGEDYWVSQRISRGLPYLDGEMPEREGPTVVIECTPLPLRARATLFRDGIDVLISAVRRIAPEALSPRAKTTNYLNMQLAALEVKDRNPGAWAILLDARGNLCEGNGSNLFLVQDGVVRTPREEFVLPGISRQTVMEICADLGIPCKEADLSLYDAAVADEAFITSTSLCLCPVRSIDGQTLAAGRVPGPVTQRIIGAYAKLVGMDFVAQYLRFLPAG